jgi:decaprenylphospho-beta-D-erythro-pentofuranosid-2-ulose 2-reductase
VKAVFVGATRGMGRALARRVAERGDRLWLLGRDPRDLEASCHDLAARGAGAPVGWACLDLARTEGFGAALDGADRGLEGMDTMVVSAGTFARQDELTHDPARLAALLHVNFTATVVLCQMAAERLAERGGGTICAFSSVAGDRARRTNYLYGAGKAGLSAFLDGLDMAYADRGVRVVCVRPGFIRTRMTDGIPVPPLAGNPDDVARVALRAIDRRQAVVYAPSVWRWVMLVIRLLPRGVMRRLSF